MNAETSAEFASDLYSHLDSSGGDYTDIQEQLASYADTDKIAELQELVTDADAELTDAFELLDENILPAIEYKNSRGQFTRDVKEDVRAVVDSVERAESLIEEALELSQTVSKDSVPDDFQFGVHTEIDSAFKYLSGDVNRMFDLANEMERKY